MNVLQVLTVTTVLYFAFVVVWVVKMEDLLQERTERRYDGADRSPRGEP